MPLFPRAVPVCWVVAIEVQDGGGVCRLRRKCHEDSDKQNDRESVRVLGEARKGRSLRAVAEAVLQLIMETDAKDVLSTARQERSAERTT